MPEINIETEEKDSSIPKNKINLKIIGIIFVALIIFLMLLPPEKAKDDSDQSLNTAQTSQKTEETDIKTDQELMYESISSLIENKEAFDVGSYVKGEIPEGEYAYIPFEGSGKYYSEEDSAGNIIDNENFDSFGYVYVHSSGNLKTESILIKIATFDKLGAKSAKEIYEKLNDIEDYKDSAMYKAGVDIEPGTYTIESYGSAYVEVASGPVGNSDIIDNDNFNGKYSVNISNGQYLKISRGKLLY